MGDVFPSMWHLSELYSALYFTHNCRARLNITIDYMNLRFSLSLILIVFLVSCSEFSRPSVEEAKANFLKRYPEAEIVEIKITEDEVFARSFEFTYRRKGDQVAKKIDLQFMGTESGSYEMRPDPPIELP